MTRDEMLRREEEGLSTDEPKCGECRMEPGRLIRCREHAVCPPRIEEPLNGVRERLRNEIARLTAENAALRARIEQLEKVAEAARAWKSARGQMGVDYAWNKMGEALTDLDSGEKGEARK